MALFEFNAAISKFPSKSKSARAISLTTKVADGVVIPALKAFVNEPVPFPIFIHILFDPLHPITISS